jgi:holin-like protein
VVLFGVQLAGEALARGLDLPVPGPVLGFAALALALWRLPRLRPVVEPAAIGILRYLSLLFVPAAVGIIQQAPLLGHEGVAIGVAVAGSTWIAMAVTALVFRALARNLRPEGGA